MAAQERVKRLVRAPVRLVRKAVFPEYTALLADVPAAHQGITTMHERMEDLVRRMDDLTARVESIDAGLLEARRLSLRVAELTDLVTEVVLPLHDREIDASRFDTLADDTL